MTFGPISGAHFNPVVAMVEASQKSLSWRDAVTYIIAQLVVAFAGVGAYIAAAYWFTASTSFANPAVTLARTMADTFAGIRPTDAPGFTAAQVAGAFCAMALFRWLVPNSANAASQD